MLTRMMNDFAPLFRLHDEMSRMFDRHDRYENFFDGAPAAARPYGAAYPALNTWEDADAAYVEAELPGLSMDDLEVLVCGNEVTIKGERKLPQPQGTDGAQGAQATGWHRRERAQGQFTRTLTLPWPVDADKVEARLADGVLSVRLPKAEAAKPRKVKVIS